MRKYLLLLLFFVVGNVYSQTIIQPLITGGFSFQYLNFHSGASFNKFALGGGISRNEQLNAQLTIGYNTNQRLISSEVKKIEFMSSNLSLDYRFLRNFWVSPLIQLDFGVSLHSNAKNKEVNNHLELLQDNSIYKIGYFQKFGIMTTPRIMCSFKINSFYISIGAGYTMTSVYISPDSNMKGYIISLQGLTINSGCSYIFKMKK